MDPVWSSNKKGGMSRGIEAVYGGVLANHQGIVMRTISRILLACAALSLLTPAFADTPEPQYSLNIARQSLTLALKEFSRQTGLAVGYLPTNASEERTLVGPLKGRYTVDTALSELLAPSGLSFERINARTIAVTAPDAQKSSSTGADGSRRSGAEESLPAKTGEEMRLARRGLQLAERGTDQNSASAPRSSSETAAGDADLKSIQEVIVTATKREQRLQDVPMSIAVISNQDIERRGFIGMEDYLRSIPGVNQIDNGAMSNAIVIRGVATSLEFENGFTGGPTVATYFDESPITGGGGITGGGIDLRPVDIERIEVLRGPQGTTYGSASLGGAVRIIPVKPKLDAFGAKVGAAYSDTSGFGSDNSMMQGIVNIPLIKDKLALRAVAYRYDDSGYYRNIAGVDPQVIANADAFGVGNLVRGYVRDDIGRMVSTGGRVAALWQATDELSLSMNFLTQKIEQDGRPLATVGTYEQAVVPIAPPNRQRGQSAETADTNMDLLNLVLNYDFGWAKLTSAASWIDSGSVYSSVIDLGFPTALSNPSDFESFTFEARLASNFAGRFQFLGGVFYEDVTEKNIGTTLEWLGTPAPSPIFVSNPLLAVDQGREVGHHAVFGEVSYDLTDRIKASAGARFFKYDKELRILQEGALVGVPIGSSAPVVHASDESSSSFKANLSYKPTQDALLYASWAEGFRLGRPDQGIPAAVCDLDNDGLIDGSNVSVASTRTVNSDFLDNYEIGGKFALFGRRMTVDAAVYRINWDGLPIATTLPGCSIGYTANAGAATSEGVEFQARLIVTEGLRLDFGGGYIRAKLTEDAPNLGARAGDRLPGSPKVSANFGAQYDFSVAGRNAFVRVDSFYTGRFYRDLLESPGLAAGDYTKVDTRAGLLFNTLSVELFVRNVTNEDAYTWRGFPSTVPAPGYRLRPRTIGVQLGYTFE